MDKYYFLFKDFVLSGKSWDSGIHQREALSWLYRAHDANADGGVSHSYQLGKGWMRSYPETTGYIIPTLLNWHAVTGDDEARRRALEMADWELTVQFPEGAIPGLSTGEPVVFDTGQVLFGWLAAYAETHDKKYLDAAARGGDWLLDVMDLDATWRRFGNPGSSEPNLYNVRFAWALLELTRTTGDERYRSAVERFLNWVLAQEVGRGWFLYNCLTDNERPLLHTIAYTAQGMLETGVLLQDQRCLDAVLRTADELLALVQGDGRMPGRFDQNWHPAVEWCCLTGMAQMAIVWQRLHQIGGNEKYRDAARRVLGFVKGTQDLATGNLGVRGGIKGSYPVNGGYCRYRLPNWAAKFYLDALFLEADAGFSRPLY